MPAFRRPFPFESPTRLVPLLAALATGLFVAAGCGGAAAPEPEPEAPVTENDDYPNPYTAEAMWGNLPDDRTWGSISAVYPAADGNLWTAERCGQNYCGDRPEVDPIVLFTPEGEVVRSFGAGLISWPHGMFVDHEGFLWVTDACGFDDRCVPEGKGHQVLKFSPEGEVLLRLGEAGVPGDGDSQFDMPSDVLVSPEGVIFVADGHGSGGNNRISKFSADGEFLGAFGETGTGPGQFRDPHALAMDSEGRLFVGDRANNRVQVLDQDGNFLEEWLQFGRPSGVFITADDLIHVADSESTSEANPGFSRGIRIGSARDGTVTHFLPDDVSDLEPGAEPVTSGPEGVAVGADGSVYGGEVRQRMIRKFSLPARSAAR